MRFHLAVAFLTNTLSTGAAFAPTQPSWGILQRRPSAICSSESLRSTAAESTETSPSTAVVADHIEREEGFNGVPEAAPTVPAVPITAAEVKARLERQLEKLREKDSSSPQLSKEDLKVVYEDEHIVVVDKPSGVLCVSSGKKEDGSSYPNLAQAVHDAVGCEMGRADKMVVHRLGMDTSGLVVFAKTMEAVRGMNSLFRTRKIERTYEALVCGRVEKDEGMIHLPLMRDYEFPPFMRVSTEDRQRALLDLDPDEVGSKKIFENPKESLTKYRVLSREEKVGDDEGLAVTRLALTSISGRTHQLNVHLAAFGHPIVGDSTYGIGGDAAPNGGLSETERDVLALNGARADDDLQRRISAAVKGKPASIHAKSLKFRHPVTKEIVEFTADAPF